MQEQDPRTYAIIGAAMEVHRELGAGFLEPVYQEALAQEFHQQGIPFEREVALHILYKGTKLNTGYRANFICYGDILVELKAQNTVGRIEAAQVLNYLKATGIHIGLLLNFGELSLYFKRFAN